MKKAIAWLGARGSRFVSAEALNVAPALVGRTLATPARRAVAVGIDLGAIALLSNASGWWLASALVLLAVLLYGALRDEGARAVVRAVVVGVVLAAAAWTAWQAWSGADRDEAPAKETRPALADDASDGERLERARAELHDAREALERRTLLDQAKATLDDFGASFGWGIVYFSLVPALWRGQTLGKRLLRLRIVELTGKPITPLRGFKRYGGYAAGMATGGLGFLQMLWEPNRQGLQDKAAHTVVLDERVARAAGVEPGGTG